MILKRRYCILEKIGQGGEGSLYVARDMELGVYRAVKELPISGKREAKLLCLLEHPAIPAMVDYEEKTEHCYLVMEYIRGKSLGTLLREGRSFTRQEILEFTFTAAEALEYLHNRRPPVYYGDLKPDNLMLSENGRLYLVDYGSAVFGYRRRQRTVMGTVGFAAPEQYEGFVDAGSDIYALGKTLWALAGRQKAKLLLGCPRLGLFLIRCRQKDNLLRFQTMAQAKAALQKLLYRRRRTKGRKVLLAAVLLTLAGFLLLAQNRLKRDFYDELTEAAAPYGTAAFYEGEPEEQAEIILKVEERLKKMLSQYGEADQQKRLLLLLAAGSELGDRQKDAELYYEQLLLYQKEDGESWAQYGRYLMRAQKQQESAALWEEYKEQENAVTDSPVAVQWEEEVNAWKKQQKK